jgi:gliding motility-associated-like protein
MIYTVDDTTICNGDSARLNVFGEPSINFLWTPNTNISDSSIINPWVYPNSTTTYTITATNSQGCIDQDDVTVEISDIQALFTSDLDGGCDGAIVTFINTSDPSLDFIWYFNDASTSTDEIVEHTFAFDENYYAYLEVNNFLGCIDSSFFSGNTLSFEDYFDINIPNVFTPNGDNENDMFIVEVPGKIYECVDMKIYNRWGQVVFISTGNNLKWDGRTNVGIPAPEGTYFYTIDIKEKSYNGSLSLFR